jgi:hypothetical protein
MFVVQKRNALTLISLIKQNIKAGSEIVSDEWKAYHNLNAHGFQHFTVNHSESYVDPETKKHTQLMECLWGHSKSKIMRSMKRTSQANLQQNSGFDQYILKALPFYLKKYFIYLKISINTL